VSVTPENPLLLARNRAAKTGDKKLELAWHALDVLAELGFARVNLREIANRSGLSLGRIHYYFEDKTEILIVAVNLYKDRFVRRIEELIALGRTEDEAVANFAEGLAEAIEQDAKVHRLWYDVRAQSLFDEAFRPFVDRMEARLLELIRLLLKGHDRPDGADMDAEALRIYLAVDGWFQHFLRRRLSGVVGATEGLHQCIAREFAVRRTPRRVD
jgi:AcrR family transcriptional regulator